MSEKDGSYIVPRMTLITQIMSANGRDKRVVSNGSQRQNLCNLGNLWDKKEEGEAIGVSNLMCKKTDTLINVQLPFYGEHVTKGPVSMTHLFLIQQQLSAINQQLISN